MKKQFLFSLFLLAVFLTVPVLAQKASKSKPDLSGTWVFSTEKKAVSFGDLQKSNYSSPMSIKKTTNRVVIEHSDPMIKFTETLLNETFDGNGKLLDKNEVNFLVDTFYMDKRGERNTFENQLRQKSMTKWDGRHIVITKFSIHNQKSIVIKLTLSKNGNELKVQTKGFSTAEYDQYATLRQPVFSSGSGEEKIYKRVVN